MRSEKQKLINSVFFPFLFVILLWLIKGLEAIFSYDLSFLGIHPLHYKGLIGIITAPLIHADYRHLFLNTIPILILGTGIFYFYKSIAFKVIILSYLLTGLWVWFGGRDASHIGASGLIYAFAAFLFFSGIIRHNSSLIAISLLVAFLYGGMLWGVFPLKKDVSWESHLMGFVAGSVLAVYFRKKGPKRKRYEWEDEPVVTEHTEEFTEVSITDSYTDLRYFYIRKKSDKKKKQKKKR